VGRRRHGRRLAEGADAAAGAVLQRGLEKALKASKDAKLPRSFWDWEEMLGRTRPAISLHPGHQHAAGAEGRARDAAGGRASTPSSAATTGRPRRRGAPCATGVSRSSAATRTSIPPRSPRSPARGPLGGCLGPKSSPAAT
jgi:hypothetical protein